MPLIPAIVTGAQVSTLLSYQPVTAPVSITATTEATANLVVTADSIALDGQTMVEIEFFCPQLASPNSASGHVSIVLYQSFNGGATASISEFWGVYVTNAAATIQGPACLKRIFTPAIGTYVWSVRGWVNTGTGTVQAGTGGLGEYMPAFVKVMKVL